MPGVYHYLDKDFLEFFEQLGDTDQLTYFDRKAI